MNIEKVFLQRKLKILNWILKNPLFSTNRFSCELFTEEGKWYIGVVAQDAYVKLYLGQTDEQFHVAIPCQAFEKVVSILDQDIQLELQDNILLLRDTFQQVQLKQVETTQIPAFSTEEEIHTFENCLPVLTHLHQVATEQVDSTDLDISFTGSHAFIGNYMYAKRLPYTTDISFVLNGTILKLILFCLADNKEQSIQVSFTQNFVEYVHIQIGEHSVYTSLFSRNIPQVDRLFQEVQAEFTSRIKLTAFINILNRIHKLSKNEQVTLNFQEDNTLHCLLPAEYYDSQIECQYDGNPINLQVSVSVFALYHLMKKVSDSDYLHFIFDTQREVMIIQNGQDEMIVSILLH